MTTTQRYIKAIKNLEEFDWRFLFVSITMIGVSIYVLIAQYSHWLVEPFSWYLLFKTLIASIFIMFIYILGSCVKIEIEGIIDDVKKLKQ